MARSFNQVTLMGNLTRDPELRSTPSGQSVCNFGLALNRSYKNAEGEWVEATDFVDIDVTFLVGAPGGAPGAATTDPPKNEEKSTKPAAKKGAKQKGKDVVIE